MPDIYLSAGGNRSIKYKDMGDGTQAEVVYIGGGSTGSSSALPAGTDRSGTITTGGTAQQLAPANSSRTSLTGQNISTGGRGHHGYARSLPTLAGVSGLLTAVITGINTVTTALSGFNLFTDPAAGVVVNVLVIEPSA